MIQTDYYEQRLKILNEDKSVAIRTILEKEIDLKELCDFAIKNGATRAKVIDAGLIVVDGRVQLKCRYPPCLYCGKNLMCLLYTPSVKEFRERVAK